MRHHSRGVAVDPELLWFPPKAPRETRGFTLNIEHAIDPENDVIASATAAIAPSGEGELVATALTIVGYDLTLLLTGGQPGRRYRHRILVTMVDGDVAPFEVLQDVSPDLPTEAAPPPPSSGFGIPITGIFMPAPLLRIANGLVGTGSTQGNALPLPAWTNIIVSAPSGTGFILSTPDEGTVAVLNLDPVNNAQVYPPVGAQINELGVNTPFIVGANGGRIEFSTVAATVQWGAG